MLRLQTMGIARTLRLATVLFSNGLIMLGAELKFSGATEALGMMVQVIGQLEEKVQGKDLASIHSEDLILNESLAAILQQSDQIEAARREQFQQDVKQFGQQVASLHLAGDTGRQTLAEQHVRSALETFARIQTHFPKTTVEAARGVAARYLCPAHYDVRGKKMAACPKCGSPLNQQVRLLPPFCGSLISSRQSARASVRTDQPLVPGQTVTAYIQLSQPDGSPLFPSDLILSHTEKIHLLIIDSALADYHHEHPRFTATPGEYSFSFTPRKAGSYLVWAELRRQPIGLQEYATTAFPDAPSDEPLADRTVTNRATLDGLIYDVTFMTEQLRAGIPSTGRLRVTDASGKPFTRLEPFMDSFVHLVGFNADRRNVLHIHPKGSAENPSARGGPDFEFQLYSLHPGFVRLFAQVRIEGAMKAVPFGVEILP